MKYSIKDVKSATPVEKVKSDSLWLKMWVRPATYPLAALCLNMGITPNTISVVTIIVTVAAFILMCINNPICMVVGLFVMNLWIVFDCMDGNMARTLKQNSYMGEFYDAMGGYTVCALSLLGAGILGYHSGRNVFEFFGAYLMPIGAMGSITDIFSRLVYQKYTANSMIADAKRGREIVRENDTVSQLPNKLNILYIRSRVDKELGPGGFFPPILLIAYFVKTMDIVVVFYTLYHVAALVVILYIFCRKATRYDKEARKEQS
jgi:phosphatidylglycerophosphate synthase